MSANLESLFLLSVQYVFKFLGSGSEALFAERKQLLRLFDLSREFVNIERARFKRCNDFLQALGGLGVSHF